MSEKSSKSGDKTIRFLVINPRDTGVDCIVANATTLEQAQKRAMAYLRGQMNSDTKYVPAQLSIYNVYVGTVRTYEADVSIELKEV